MQVRKAVERRRFAIQAVFSLLTNSYVVGFLTGTIYKGPLKQICVPGMNCYSCPGALGACPIGSLQAIFNQSDFSKGVWSDSNGYLVTKPLYYFAFYVVGFLMLVGALCGRLVCGFLCPFGLIQDLLHKIPLPKKLKIRTFPAISSCVTSSISSLLYSLSFCLCCMNRILSSANTSALPECSSAVFRL